MNYATWEDVITRTALSIFMNWRNGVFDYNSVSILTDIIIIHNGTEAYQDLTLNELLGLHEQCLDRARYYNRLLKDLDETL